ncbi:MAG: medium chain dehydrogenase/reductase family protein [Nannocystaceae bacterium]|nr:medium chain dehydrogenase/reductase family protein [Nannocystaceae bacterium]
MATVVIHRKGGYERLVLEQHPVAPVGPQDVHVSVAAAGVNYADCVVRMGLYQSAKDYVGWPITPGFEVAGLVARVGSEVRDVAVGDAVIAVTRFGGYTSDLVVPRRQVFAVPRGLSLQQAAAVPAVYLTAYHALCELAQPRPGATVLVHSAAGGVGGALVQIARIRGCRVVAVVGSPHKVDHARALGADVVIDRSREPLWSTAASHAPAGYDVVLDANGIATLRGSYRALAPMGKLVVYGFASMLPRAGQRLSWLRLAWHFLRTPRFSPFELTNRNRSVMGFNLSYLFDHTQLLRDSMAQLQQWFEDGALRPPPITPVPLTEVAAAHRLLESGATIGKLVLVPGAA